MRDEHLLAQLPETYAAALRLQAEGLSDRAIAAALSVEPEAVGALMLLANEKLATLRSLRWAPAVVQNRQRVAP